MPRASLKTFVFIACLSVQASGRRSVTAGLNVHSAESMPSASVSLDGDVPDDWQEGGEDPDLNFQFMTDDFSYTGHEKSMFGTVKEWFGGRATSDEVRPEIVNGHFCQKRGTRDETYYAASFCYWLPDIQSPQKAQNAGMALGWKGGSNSKSQAFKSFYVRLRAEGECAKFVACHNNGRGEDGEVSAYMSYEPISLPSDCLKESHIEAHIISMFDQDSAELKQEDTRCHSVQGRFNDAVAALQLCLRELKRLPTLIENELPRQIHQAQQERSSREQKLQFAKGAEHQARGAMRNQCREYQRLGKSLHFQNLLLGATPTEQLLSMMTFHCSYPTMPHDNHDGSHWDEMARYNNRMATYRACQRCESGKNNVKRANRKRRDALSALTRVQKRIPKLQQQLATAKNELQEWQQQQPSIAAAKDAMDQEWLPQEAGCKKTFEDYIDGKKIAIIRDSASYYNRSCEKACIESTAKDAGCGVIEGDHTDDPGTNLNEDWNTRGGMEAHCAPPQPSWIMGPYTYGESEPDGQQCGRIGDYQEKHYAQRVLKAGWLWKKGRINGWQKRFFVLESGDAVRSAVLRYYTHDPMTTMEAEERAGKGIILWDAKGVKAKTGANYGWKDGEECFKIYHFYRDYRLCVPSVTKTTTDPVDSDVSFQDPGMERDDWLDLIASQIDQGTPKLA